MSDFLVTVLRDALARHRGLRLILMSATVRSCKVRLFSNINIPQVDTQQLLTYFPGAQHISVGGNMFPVEQFHLEDILEATGYCSRQMSKQKQMQRSRQSLEDLTQQLVLGNTGKQKQQHVEEVEEDLVVVEEEQEESVGDGDEEVVVVDPTMDHILGQCFLNGADEDFVNLEQQVGYSAKHPLQSFLLFEGVRGRKCGLQALCDRGHCAYGGGLKVAFFPHYH